MSLFEATITNMAPATVRVFRSARGETLTVRLVFKTTANASVSTAGSNVVLFWSERGASPPVVTRLSQPGTSSGITVFTFTAEQTENLSASWYQFNAWLETGDVRSPLFVSPAVVQITPTIAFSGPPNPPEITAPEIIQTHEITGSVENTETGVVPVAPYVVMTLSGACVFVVTVPSLHGANADLAAAGYVAFGRHDAAGVWTRFATRPALVQAVPGEFRASIPVSLRIEIGDDPVSFDAVIVSGGESWIVSLGSVSFVETANPMSIAPVVTMLSLSATVTPGLLAIGGTYTDPDSAIAPEQFTVTVGGVAQSPVFETENGTWSSIVSLDTVGSVSIVVTLADDISGYDTATRSTEVVLPTLAISQPTDGSSFDAQTITMIVGSSPALPDSTAVNVYDGGTVVGSGTFASGVASVTTSALTEGDHTLIASIITLAGVVTSPSCIIHVTDALPEVTTTAPLQGSTVAAGAVLTSATVTHSFGRPMLVRARIETGGFYPLERIGLTDTYLGASDSESIDGSHTLTIQATDALNWTTSAAITTITTTFAISYDTAWNSGNQTFEAQYRSTVAPSSGDVLLALSAVGAVDGGILRISVPAGVTGFGLVMPDGYQQHTDASVEWAGGVLYSGAELWAEGSAWTGVFRIDTTAHTITVSGSRDDIAALPASAVLARMATGGSNSATLTDRAGIALAAQKETNLRAITDPSAARGVNHGTVLRGGGARDRFPIAGSMSSGFSWAGWVRIPAVSAALLVAAPAQDDPVFGTEAGFGLFVANDEIGFGCAWGSRAAAFSMPFSVYPTPADQWHHIAISVIGLTETLYYDGSETDVTTLSRAPGSPWAAGVDNGSGVQIGAVTGFANDWVFWARQMLAPSALSQQEAAAHLRLAAPPATTHSHVLTMGSSLLDYSDATDLAESTRILTTSWTGSLAIPLTHWHHYARSGAPVSDPYVTGGIQSMQLQWRDGRQWLSRGLIVVCDLGTVVNQSGGANDAKVQSATTIYAAEVRKWLACGATVVMLDFLVNTEPCSGVDPRTGETWANLGECVNYWQHENIYTTLGGAIIRAKLREWLGATWADQVWRSDGVHYSQAAIDVFAPRLATLLDEINSQPDRIIRPFAYV